MQSGPHLAAIFSPPGLNSAANCGPGQFLAANFSPGDRFWVGPDLALHKEGKGSAPPD